MKKRKIGKRKATGRTHHIKKNQKNLFDILMAMKKIKPEKKE